MGPYGEKDPSLLISELIARQGSSFNVYNVIDAAKSLDKSIKKTSDLNEILTEQGFTIYRNGHRFLAARETEQECTLCHRPASNGRVSGVTPEDTG